MNPNNPNAHTDAIRKTLQVLTDLVAQARESGHRAAAESEDAETLARIKANAAKTYNEHANILQEAINALAGHLDADAPMTSAPVSEIERQLMELKARNAQKHDPYATKSAY
jgi:hypothetical protein